MSSKYRMTRIAAYKAFQDNGHRHARNIATDQPGSKVKLFGPDLLATYESECRRKRHFIKETVEAEQRLGRMVKALRVIMSDTKFRSLLVSESLATMPKSLAQRLQGTTVESQTAAHACESPSDSSAQSVGGICPDVLNFLQDYPVKVKIFGLLRHVLPARQLEIAKLMVAMERVTFTYEKLLVAFTPRALLAEGFDPTTVANASKDQLDAMTPELDRLSREFLSAVERRGSVSLELLAAGRYLDRLMNNPRAVRYLARNLSGHFEEFHNLSVPYK